MTAARRSTARPLVVAHAGCEGTGPDSLESVAAGIAAGADVVEVDVRFLPDGTPVLSHDALGGNPGTGLVRLERVVSLLLASPGIALNVDMKEPHAASMGPVVAPLAAENRVYATGLAACDIPVFARECPGIPYDVNIPGDAVRFRSARALRELVRESRALGARALCINHRCVSRRLFAVCAGEAFPLHVWTVDDARSMRRMISRGAASVTTRRVAVLAGLVRGSAGG
jgi:glycerophosphoryl diester phosphodiesterase